MNKSNPNATKTIQFNCHANGAKSAGVAGTFNNWDASQTPLRRDKNGGWTGKAKLPPGRHEYRFVVDGEWRDDPQATERVPNPHGTTNAVLVV